MNLKKRIVMWQAEENEMPSQARKYALFNFLYSEVGMVCLRCGVIMLMLINIPAWAINKCIDPTGTVSYQEGPCEPAALGKQLQIQNESQTSSEDSTLNNAIARGRVMTGMNANQVRRAWGKPSKINSSIGSYGKHEQWVYDRGRARAQYVYIENGLVTSIQSPE